MRTHLAALLERADVAPPGGPEFSLRHMLEWPPALRDRMTAAGLLRQARARGSVECDECDEDHVSVVHQIGRVGLAWCPTAGRTEVAVERLAMYRFDFEALATVLRTLVGADEPLREVVRDRLWRLGVVEVAGGSATFFFGRGLAWPDAGVVLARSSLQRAHEPVLFSLSEQASPVEGARVVPLPRVLTLSNAGFSIDVAVARTALLERRPQRGDFRLARHSAG